MKLLTALFMLMFAVAGMASSQTKTFHFDGSQDSVAMSLRAEKTHTEYRYEQRYTMCYRQETHWQTICRPGPHGQPVCTQTPVTRTVSYPCWQTVSVPYEVKDYDVEASVNLSVAQLPEGATANETFKVTLDGDNLYVSAIGSKKYFILLTKKEIQEQRTGSLKLIDASFGTELVEAAPVVKALDMTNISYANSSSVLTFKMGPVTVRDLIGFSLEIKKNPVVGSSTTLFDRELSANEIMINSQENSAVADVNVQKLGVELGGGRHTLTARAFFKHAGTIINKGQFERVEASRTLILKR